MAQVLLTCASVELVCNLDIIAFEQKLNYIHNNPIQSGFVDNPVHYPYSSAVDYADGKGYIKIVLAR